VAVWEDHLLPLLTCKEAARLACTCEALKQMLRGHFRDLGVIPFGQLKAALTTFPRAREVTLHNYGELWAAGDKDARVEWLREGRGRHLVKVWTADGPPSDVVHTALRRGALPSLRGVNAHLSYQVPRASLTGGFLRAMHELHLTVSLSDDLEPQLAALGRVRQLAALAKLELPCSGRPSSRPPSRPSPSR
jgi:hypothetical protein